MRLAAIWQSVIVTPESGSTITFFELWGGFLLARKMASVFERELRVRIDG